MYLFPTNMHIWIGIGKQKWQIIFVVVDLLSLKLFNFRLIVAYFGTLRMHQIAPFLSNFSGGGGGGGGKHAPGTPPLSSTGSILANTDLSDLSSVGTCDIFVYQMRHRVM